MKKYFSKQGLIQIGVGAIAGVCITIALTASGILINQFIRIADKNSEQDIKITQSETNISQNIIPSLKRIEEKLDNTLAKYPVITSKK